MCDDNHRGETVHEVDVGGVKFVCADTRNGDGVYLGNNTGFQYGVDAGLIGVVPEELVHDSGSPDLGQWFDIDRDFTTIVEVWRTQNGMITISHGEKTLEQINTESDDDEDDDYEGDDDE